MDFTSWQVVFTHVLSLDSTQTLQAGYGSWPDVLRLPPSRPLPNLRAARTALASSSLPCDLDIGLFCLDYHLSGTRDRGMLVRRHRRRGSNDVEQGTLCSLFHIPNFVRKGLYFLTKGRSSRG